MDAKDQWRIFFDGNESSELIGAGHVSTWAPYQLLKEDTVPWSYAVHLCLFIGLYTLKPHNQEEVSHNVSAAHLIRTQDCCSAAQSLATQDISPLNSLHLLEQHLGSLCGEVKVKRILMQALWIEFNQGNSPPPPSPRGHILQRLRVLYSIHSLFSMCFLSFLKRSS
jgi:hypothetical protein